MNLPLKNKIPGPGIFSLLKNTNRIRKDPLAFGEALIDEYGNSIKIRVGPYNVVALNDPAHHQWVLKDNWLNYIKGKAYEKMGPLMGEGLLMAEHDFWRQNRSIIQPAFRLNRLPFFFDELKGSCERIFEDWEKEERFNFHQEMMRLTLSVISRSLFQVDLGKDSHSISEAIHDFMAGMEEQIFHITPLQKHIPTRVNRKAKKAVKYLDSFVYKIIENRRQETGEKEDLVSLLIHASLKDGAKGITDKYLRDEIMNFFIGGHETTANAITWTLFCLGKNKNVLQKVLQEINTSKIGELELSDLEKCPYLDQVINESIRMYPPIWIISRETRAKDEIEGMEIPKGSIMVVSPYFLHHRKDIWPDPHKFDPERFSEGETKKRPKNSFLPFGLGPRSCLGEMMARMEMKTFLVMFLKKYEFTIDEKVPVIPLATITLRPKNGMYVFIKKRNL